MTRMAVGARSVRAVVVVQLCLLAFLAATGPVAAESDTDGDQSNASESGGARSSGASLALVVVGVVGDGVDDGDLSPDPGSGLPTLIFRHGGPPVQTAVFAYTVTNTGPVPVHAVELVDDHLGAVLVLAADEVLEPGAAVTARAERQFTYDQVAGGSAGLLVQHATASASDEQDGSVTAEGEATVQLVAVAAAPQLQLTKQVVLDAGDVVTAADGMPVVSWTAAERSAGEQRLVRYRLTVVNTGATTLHAVEVVDPLLGATPVLAVSEGRALAPGEDLALEVDLLLAPDDVLPVGSTGTDGWVEGTFSNVATASGRDEAGVVVTEATAEALLRLRAEAPAEVLAEVLPAAGGVVALSPGGVAGTAVLAVGMVGLGMLLLRRARRPLASA